VSGEIAYPDATLPPGLSAGEAAAGAVLLCQARPRSALVIETRLIRTASVVRGEILAVDALAFDALRLRLRLTGRMAVRPGQYLDCVNPAGLASRLPVIAVREGEMELEASADGSAFREWLSDPAALGAVLSVKGPFDTPR
jgi:hypothetical protein